MNNFGEGMKMFGRIGGVICVLIGFIPLLTGDTLGAICCTVFALFLLELTR